MDTEIERVKLVERTVLFQKLDKKVGDSTAFVFRYHPALRRAHKHVLKSPRPYSSLPLPSRVTFRNPKTIRDKLVCSKLKEFI